MADDVQLMIADAKDDDIDAWLLTNLAADWGRRLLVLAELKQFKDGNETIGRASVPSNISHDAAPVYQQMRSIGTLNLARRISESVSDRQRPNGFRKVGNTERRDTKADDMYRQCRMDMLLRRFTFPETADYGESFVFVGPGRGGRYVSAVSPWNCHMSEDQDTALLYSYDARAKVERMELFRIDWGDEDTGREEVLKPKRVYSRMAFREVDRSVCDPDDDEQVSDFVEKGDAWSPGTDWQWSDEGEIDYAYALEECCLPLVRDSTPDGKGLFEPHLDTLKRIDRQIFDRLCISMMQAFRQRAVKGSMPTTYTEEDAAVIAGTANAGDPIDLSATFATGPAALWNLPDGVDIWESQTTDFSTLQNTINADIKHLAATAGIPLDILSPDVQGSANGAELKRETLRFKVENMNDLAADAIVRIIRMALRAAGTPPSEGDDFELMWKPMASMGSLELTQAAQLAYQSGLMSRRTALTKFYGFTAQDIAEDEASRMYDQLTMSDGVGASDTAMAGAVSPATGWDQSTGGAVNGLPEEDDDVFSSDTGGEMI